MIGSRVRFEGEPHVLIGCEGTSMRLRSEMGRVQLIATVELLEAPDFEILDVDHDKHTADTSSLLADLPGRFRAKAEKRLAHLNEVRTGYRSAVAESPATGEPRKEYDPASTTLDQRVDAKSRETGSSRRTIYRDLARYRELGLVGLVDKRLARPSSGLNLAPAVRAAIERVLQETTDKSNVSHSEIRRRVQIELEREHGAGTVECPPASTFNRKLNELTKGRGTFRTSAKARRSISNRPETPYRRFRATRPGEFVLIDSSAYDVFAVEPGSGQWITLDLTIALDLYTRSIVAWRFTPKSAKGVDAALILHDIIAWKPMRPGWPEAAGWRYLGVPDTVIIDSPDGSDDAKRPAGIPVLHPETVVVDRGRIFLSQTFQDACARLGVSIQLARPYRPTDKAHVERAFRTIRESLLEKLPGYKGPDIHSRGAAPEDEAYLFVGELEELFAEWVASWWQVRHHEGLHLPGQPKIRLSPNDMYDEGLMRWGLLHIPPSQTLYFELLPTAWRTIQHYGVDLNDLRYDGEALNTYRNTKSAHNGKHKGHWPIKYDPRDLSTVYFQDPESGDWNELRWIGQADLDRPFSDVTLRYAKQLVAGRGGGARHERNLETVLGDLVDRAVRNEPRDRTERRLAAKRQVHDWGVARDRAEAVQRSPLPELEDTDTFGDLFDMDEFDPSEVEPFSTFDPHHDGFDTPGTLEEVLDQSPALDIRLPRLT